MVRQSVILTLAAVATISACGSPSSPSQQSNYAGVWSGTTSQAASIGFTVSTEQRVTAITVGYSFNGCSGTREFSSLSIELASPRNPTVPFPAFGFSSGDPDGPNFTRIQGTFSSATAATGSVLLTRYEGCGDAAVVWSATR